MRRTGRPTNSSPEPAERQTPVHEGNAVTSYRDVCSNKTPKKANSAITIALTQRMAGINRWPQRGQARRFKATVSWQTGQVFIAAKVFSLGLLVKNDLRSRFCACKRRRVGSRLRCLAGVLAICLTRLDSNQVIRIWLRESRC